MADLKPRQKEAYEFIKEFYKENSYSPTTGEIAEALNLKSRGVAYRYLQHLQELGLINLRKGEKRNIQLLSESSSLSSSIPLFGYIAAGSPIEAITNSEQIDILDTFLGSNRYALKVKGDSMIDEGIFDDDIVICEHQSHARNGQIVVALIDNEAATLKRIHYNTNATVTLFPANENHCPQSYSESRVTIQGIFVGLLRLA